MNRRTFVATLAGAATAYSANPSARRFKVGFLGASHSHAKEKIRILQSHPAFELIGATDESAAVRNTYASLRWLGREELLSACEVVFVESAVRDHARDALAALRAGKHVHVEKPPSANLADLTEMAGLAREKALRVQVGYMWRYHPGFDAIFEAVRQGWLGRVQQVSGVMNNQLEPAQRPEWAEFKGGAFFEQASHLVDPLIRLLGTPAKVTPFLTSTVGDELVDNNVAVFQFTNALGVISNYTHQPNASRHRCFEVRGTNGTMLLKPIEPPALQVDLTKPAGPYPAGSQSVPLAPYSRYVAEIDAFAAALQKTSPLKVSLEDELLVHEWLLRSCGMLKPVD